MKKLYAIILYLLSIHFTSLIMLMLFRIMLLIVNYDEVADIDGITGLIAKSIWIGFQFDNVILCYILALPLLVLTILALVNKVNFKLIRAFNIYFIILYSLILAVSAADIPYFLYFSNHMGVSIFNWIGFSGTALGMIFQQISYYVYMLLWLIAVVGLSFCIKWYRKKLEKTNLTNNSGSGYISSGIVSIFVIGICFIGMRGGMRRHPIQISHAFICQNPFINNLGINPAFYFMQSTLELLKNTDKLDGIYSIDSAFELVSEELNIDSNHDDGTNKTAKKSAISRYVNSDPNKAQLSANVVVILMESMSSEYLKKRYEDRPLTPFLNELIEKSYYFENVYSAGVHTNNGITAALYGFPTYFEKTTMGHIVDNYIGLPITLKQNGYKTIFILPHTPHFDNMVSFFSSNGIDKLYSESDYPKEKIVNQFGVADDYLLDFSIRAIDSLSRNKKPFFTTIMTVSNHPPYYIPPAYKDMKASDDEKITAFSDAAIRKFMDEAAKTDWYDNTIFVLLGDHGSNVGEKQLYPISLPGNSIPLIIYSPIFSDTPQKLSQLALQIDVFPTIMGLLNIPYQNNSLGIDLFNENRRYSFFVTDNTLGVVDGKLLFTFNPSSRLEGLYEYANRRPDNILFTAEAKADSMKRYGISMLMVSKYLIENKLSGPERQ